jgi:hypothetical protein
VGSSRGAAALPSNKTVRSSRGAAALPGATVVYVVVGFRAGYPEVSPRNQAWFVRID